MVKSINIQVNNTCNHRCLHCNIWAIKDKAIIQLEQLKNLIKIINPDEVIDVSLTGGEPFLHPNLRKLAEFASMNFKNLETFFTNTNGMMPDNTVMYIREQAPKFKKFCLCISLEGNRKIHNKIRGVDKAYDSAIETLTKISNIAKNYSNIEIILSTTISENNASITQLKHVARIARKYNCSHSFRFAETNDTYYKNNVKLCISAKFMNSLKEYISKYHKKNPFLPIMVEHYKTGTNKIMEKNNQLICEAGNEFVFINNYGSIKPCIHSSRILTSLNTPSSFNKPEDLGSEELCPCCTECTIYPMLNLKYLKSSKSRNRPSLLRISSR